MLSELKDVHITEVLLATVGCHTTLYLGQLQVMSIRTYVAFC